LRWGVLLGRLLLQTVESGLVIVNADPDLYPMVLASVIFVVFSGSVLVTCRRSP
jgi:ribose/xylose/arabinose/galactoside ABC-type transport system permease subunit